jgi:hypothetical protein
MNFVYAYCVFYLTEFGLISNDVTGVTVLILSVSSATKCSYSLIFIPDGCTCILEQFTLFYMSFRITN